MVFFSTANAMTHAAGPGILQTARRGDFIRRIDLLVGISLGAVFMGANTYIGNGPNFMVRAIAEQIGRPDAEFLWVCFPVQHPRVAAGVRDHRVALHPERAMTGDYPDVQWDERLAEDCRHADQSAILEDLENQLDWTTIALVDDEAAATAHIVARSPGVLAGIRTVELILETTQADLQWQPATNGDRLHARQILGTLSGNAPRPVDSGTHSMNFLGHLCGIATLTAEFVAAVAGTKARVYDTRKTTPGWRRLEKYAVRCGGGHNHRLGLYAGVMIKDNHLAFWTAQQASLAAAIPVVRQMLSVAEPRTSDVVSRCWSKSRSIRCSNCGSPPRSARCSCCWTTCRSISLPPPWCCAASWLRWWNSKHPAE